MAARARGRGSGDGIDGAVLEAGLGNIGALLEAKAPEAGRRGPHVGNTASGAGTVEPRSARAQEGFRRRRTSGEAAGGPGADTELCARCRAALMADGDAPQVPDDAQSGTVAEQTGVSAGRGTHEVVQPGF